MNTAVTDELMVKSPCEVKGAGAERSPERPIATVPQVHAVADAIEPRFRTAVLLAAYCSLRRSEILALRRGDADLLHATVSVRRAVVSLATGELYLGDPKTAATGASTAELMARMGHASAAAALRYQHATADRDRAIADALSSLGEQALASVTELVPTERRTS